MLAEVKWIKITTNIFDDEKIKIIDTYPARDEILVIWFKLLALAGKSNQNGFLFMNDKIPYTREMLSAIFNRDIKSIQMALALFQKFGMIEIIENELISITNWEKHQNTDGLDKIREQTRNRVAKHRQKKAKLLTCNATSNVTVTDGNAIERDKEIDKEKDKDIAQKKVILEQCENIWKLYPCKKGKAISMKKVPKLIKEYGLEQLQRCIKRYIEYVDTRRKNGFQELNYMNGSTFFNGGYMDYLDDTYQKEETKNNTKTSGFINYEQRTYDFDALEKIAMERMIKEK